MLIPKMHLHDPSTDDVPVWSEMDPVLKVLILVPFAVVVIIVISCWISVCQEHFAQWKVQKQEALEAGCADRAACIAARARRDIIDERVRRGVHLEHIVGGIYSDDAENTLPVGCGECNVCEGKIGAANLWQRSYGTFFGKK